MGQVCFASEENEQRITELENLLKDQEMEKAELKKKLDHERERQKKYKNGKRADEEDISAEKIETLRNEKKTVFKQMLKERKNVSKLEDSINQYKSQIVEMENTIDQLKDEKRKAQRRAEEAEQNQKRQNKHHISLNHAKSSIEIGGTGNTRKSLSQQSKSNNPFGIGSVLDGINIPRVSLPGISPTHSEPPFKIKERRNTEQGLQPISPGLHAKGYMSSDIGATTDDDTFGGGTTTEVSSSDEEDAVLEQKTTLILDVDFDPQTEATHVYSWLHGPSVDPKNKQCVKQIKHQLASVLTARSEGYRQQLIHAYRDQYGKSLERDIKSKIGKGHTMQIVHGLLMTTAEYDASLISECVANWDIDPIADIICCRSIKQLRDLHEAYKKKNKLDIKKQLQALAQKDKKKTLVKVIGKIFDLDRKESKDVDMNLVNQDLNFVLTTKNFTGDTKARLVLIFTTHSVQYIKVLQQQFRLKSKDSLIVFINKKLGPKSTAGHFCKTRIQYALDPPDYYAKTIKTLGANYKKNQKKIADIFIQRLEVDLDLIKRTWAVKKYGDGKSLDKWIHSKTGGSKFGHFLSKMLDNCDRYAQFRDGDDTNKKPKWATLG